MISGPFDPGLLKQWLIILLWVVALCVLVGGPVLFYLWLVWRGRRQRRESDEVEGLPSPNKRAI